MTPATKELIEDLFDTCMKRKVWDWQRRRWESCAGSVSLMLMDDDPIVLINPEVLETSGEQTDDEGCLSVPGKVAEVTRPNYVKVSSLDMDMNPVIYEGEGLRARAMLHEMDHLDGILYGERASEPYRDLEEEEEWEE